MLTLADRAAQSFAHLPTPGLPLDDLVRRLRQAGAVAPPEVVLRAVEARPDLFRVLDPWRGPWRGERSVGARWIVALRRGAPVEGAQGRLHASLAQLGATVDDRSAAHLARWLGMMREGERVARIALRPSA